MALPFNALLLKLAPGAIVVLAIGGAGFFFGAKVKQVEVDKLQGQLREYQLLGQRVADLKSAIDASIKDKNQALVDAYSREVDKVRTDFGEARSALDKATESLKQGGRKVNTSAESLANAIVKLPAGSPEREAKIAEVLALLEDERTRQQLCAVTQVAQEQLLKLRLSFSLDAAP